MEIHTFADFLSILFQVVIIPAVPVLCKVLYNFVTAYVAEKTQTVENGKVKDYVNNATKAVMTAVVATFQTYVESLKKQGKFDEAAQEEAFNRAKATALTMLTEDMRSAVIVLRGDFDTWLDNTIEQFVLANKGGTLEDTILALTA